MKLEQLLRGIPLDDVYECATYIDMVALHALPNRLAVGLVLNRAYRKCAEHCDLRADAAWVRFRRELNRGTE